MLPLAGHPVGVIAGTVVGEGAALASGAPAWIELAVPVITGLFVLAAYLLKDWLAGKRSASPSDTQRLIGALEREAKDLRHQLERSDRQLDLALDELRVLRREVT